MNEKNILSQQNHDAELKHPIATAEFKDITEEMYKLWLDKMLDYGMYNITGGRDQDTEEGQKYIMLGLYYRMQDKLNRIYNLTISDKHYVAGEKLEDTLRDIANYAVIAQIVHNKKWK